MALLTDVAFKVIVQRYAASKASFFTDFSASFKKLSELGSLGLANVSFSIPSAFNTTKTSMRSMQLKPGLDLSWDILEDGDVAFDLVLQSVVGWLALGVSHSGRMAYPQPSYAVVGSNRAVERYRLLKQDVARVEDSAVLEETWELSSGDSGALGDAWGELADASFVCENGVSVLRFRVSRSWVTRYMEFKNTTWMIYAHGTPGVADEPLGYHAYWRGNARVDGLISVATASQPSPPAAVVEPTRTAQPQAGVTLQWTHHANGFTT